MSECNSNNKENTKRDHYHQLQMHLIVSKLAVNKLHIGCYVDEMQPVDVLSYIIS